MRRILWMLPLGMMALGGVPGCAVPTSKNTTAEAIRQEMNVVARDGSKDAVSSALLPPLSISMPKLDARTQEARFDLAVNNTPASQVFMAIASGTRYNMLVPPEVAGSISLNLKDVTVMEALDAIRELYGYDYKVSGSRIYIQPIALQTKLFHVSYLTSTRAGSSSLSVSSASSGASTGGTGTGAGGGGGGTGTSTVTTTTGKSNFWTELETSLKAIVGSKDGREVIINAMSGVIVVRAMPDELRNVTEYLRASQISIERQVILEAKIIEVQLKGDFQSGVNWAAFQTNQNSRIVAGMAAPGSQLGTFGNAMNAGPIGMTAAGAMTVGTGIGSMFGLAFQTRSFAAMLDFLETQGNVHVLSSPRIATLNNQKAILKVGSDEYFVTGFSPGTLPTQTTPGTSATPTYSPMFSGISLDVTPSISESNEVILHVHPSVSSITPQNVAVQGGVVPMATTSISETDSVVRARDGQIVVIGGLMRQSTVGNDSGLPGLPKLAFGSTSRTTDKRELILLLKPTVVESDMDWSDDITRSRDRISRLDGVSGQ